MNRSDFTHQFGEGCARPGNENNHLFLLSKEEKQEELYLIDRENRSKCPEVHTKRTDLCFLIHEFRAAAATFCEVMLSINCYVRFGKPLENEVAATRVHQQLE